jgi:hypothetical protein
MWSNIEPGKVEEFAVATGLSGRGQRAHEPSHFKGRASANPKDLGDERGPFAPFGNQERVILPPWIT